MKALIINREVELEESKILGDVYLPESWLMEDVFSPYEFFNSSIGVLLPSLKFFIKSFFDW